MDLKTQPVNSPCRCRFFNRADHGGLLWPGGFLQFIGRNEFAIASAFSIRIF